MHAKTGQQIDAGSGLGGGGRGSEGGTLSNVPSSFRYTIDREFRYIVDIPRVSTRGEPSSVGFEGWTSVRYVNDFSASWAGTFQEKTPDRGVKQDRRRKHQCVSRAEGPSRTGRRTGRQREEGETNE
jgi:hypothetical protein